MSQATLAPTAATAAATATAANASASAPLDYLLHLADNALVLGQRNAEWCGHGPILEEDIALTNIALDHIGQARLLYQYAARLMGDGASEDRLAYWRDVPQFRNYTLLELPHHGPLAGTARAERDYASTIGRNFLYSALMSLVWQALSASADTELAAIAAKSHKEVRYHLRHARDWVLRLGDGTPESHQRMQAALAHLMPYTQEFWTVSAPEQAALANGSGVDMAALRPGWLAYVNETLSEARLAPVSDQGFVSRGKEGQHSEHLGYLLGEMQSLARQHPDAVW